MARYVVPRIAGNHCAACRSLMQPDVLNQVWAEIWFVSPTADREFVASMIRIADAAMLPPG